MSPLKQKGKKRTVKARKGLEWAIAEVETRLDAGYDSESALSDTGIKSMEDCLAFFEYLRMTKRQKLINRLTLGTYIQYYPK